MTAGVVCHPELFAAPKLRPYFEETKRELLIISPYFVPTRSGADLLIGLANRGVDVRILTNSLAATDVAAVHAGYKKYRKELLRNGIELYEIDNTSQDFNRKDIKRIGGSKKASLHAKSFVFDRKDVFIGSFNFDPRAAVENTEIGVVASSPEVASQVAEAFEFLTKNSSFRLELSEPKFLTGPQLRWHRTIDGDTRILNKDPNTGFRQRFSVNLIGLLPIEGLL